MLSKKGKKMTNQAEYPVNVNHKDAGIGDLFGSMFGLAAAGAKFTFQQMENAMSVFTDSQGVMNRIRTSMDKISDAMTYEADKSGFSGTPSDPLPAEPLSGRKA
jgi:hypothetical protein